jgi:hypothetical protein
LQSKVPASASSVRGEATRPHTGEADPINDGRAVDRITYPSPGVTRGQDVHLELADRARRRAGLCR